MSLLLQLLPYGMLALLAGAGLWFYVSMESERRKQGRALLSAVTAEAGAREGIPAWAPAVRAERRGTGPEQILRLHEFGIAPAQIASALRTPLEEVELVIALGQARERTGRKTEAAAQVS